VRREQVLERLVVDPPVRVERPEQELEGSRRRVLVDQADLVDEPIQSESDRRIGDPVLRGELLEGPRAEQETLEEREVLGRQVVDPSSLTVRRIVLREN